MGEWKTVFEDEVEGRLVTVKLYESAVVEDQDESAALRVTLPFRDERMSHRTVNKCALTWT